MWHCSMATEEIYGYLKGNILGLFWGLGISCKHKNSEYIGEGFLRTFLCGLLRSIPWQTVCLILCILSLVCSSH